MYEESELFNNCLNVKKGGSNSWDTFLFIYLWAEVYIHIMHEFFRTGICFCMLTFVDSLQKYAFCMCAFCTSSLFCEWRGRGIQHNTSFYCFFFPM